ncbi:uncharacterized protein BP5553_05271 [Venustampulla echinocandica]|uniref:Uncharacterized protein n=1 Tax=Venustampulla echinocandica TaxID=2656787 RepID=A0A370TQQ6_9HELO|nr:uncharacterized protein BP5553_05271 [Venustampulla echinocandica]RDL37838.1 hypothetical protein BP5553_05271 [Venustampulla echinocandica]
MSDSGDEDNRAQTERDKAMILAAMMEELGVGRMDALPLEDRRANIPAAIIEDVTARPIDPSDPIASHWKNLDFDDVNESDKLLDPIAHGQLYRQRQGAPNAQLNAQSGNRANAPNMPPGGGRGGQSNKSSRGGHHGVGQGGHHTGGNGYKGSSGKGSSRSTPGQNSRASKWEGSGARKNAHLGECVNRLRTQPNQGGYTPGGKYVSSQNASKSYQQPGRSRARELPKTTFTLASREEFFADVARHYPVQQGPNPSTVPVTTNTPRVTAPNRDTTAQESSVQVSESFAKANSPAKTINNPSIALPKGGLATSKWAPSNQTAGSTNQKAPSSKSPVKVNNTPASTLPKDGLAASKWAPSNQTTDSMNEKAPSSKSPVKVHNTPLGNLPKDGLAASKWAPSSQQQNNLSVQSEVKVGNGRGPAISLPKDGLAASKWAPPNQAARPTNKTPSRSKSPVKGTPATKAATGLQGSNRATPGKSDTIPPKDSEDHWSLGKLEAITTKTATKGESATSPQVTREHSGVEVQKDNGPIEQGNIRLTRANPRTPLVLNIYVGSTLVFSDSVPRDATFILDKKTLNLRLKQKNAMGTSWKMTFVLAHFAVGTHNQVICDLYRLNSARNEDATPARLPLADHPPSASPKEISTLSRSPDESRDNSTSKGPTYYAEGINSAPLSDLDVLKDGKELVAFGESSEDEKVPPPVGLSALADMWELNTTVLVNSIFATINAFYGPILTHISKAVGQQGLGLDAPVDELLASTPHLKASHDLVGNFFRYSETYSCMTKLEMAPYIEDLSIKLFEKALILRNDSSSNISRAVGLDPAVIDGDIRTVNIKQTVRHIYPISDLLQMRSQATVFEGELLPKSGRRKLEPPDPKNIAGYTPPGRAIVAGREENENASRSVPQFKPATSAAGWRAFADHETNVNPTTVPRSRAKSGNLRSKQTTLFSYENSATAFDINNQEILEEAKLTPSRPASVSKTTATVEDLQANSSTRGNIPEEPIQEPLAKDSTCISLGNDVATVSRIDQSNTSPEFDNTEPAEPTPATPERKPHTGNRGTKHVPSNSICENLAKTFEGLNLNVESGSYATDPATNDSGKVPSQALASVLPTSVGPVATIPIEHYNQQASQDEQQTGLHGPSAETPRPLNAQAAEYKSPPPKKGALSGLRKDLLDIKGGLAASMWAPKIMETKLNPTARLPSPVSRSTIMPSVLPPHGEAIRPAYPVQGYTLQPADLATSLTMQPGKTWRVYDPQTGNMIEIAGEIVGVTSPTRVVPMSMPGVARGSFGGQENIPISAATTAFTSVAKPSPIALSSRPTMTPGAFEGLQNVQPAPNLPTPKKPVFSFPPRANMHHRQISDASSDAGVFSAANVSNFKGSPQGRGRLGTGATPGAGTPLSPLRHGDEDYQANLQARLSQSIAKRSPPGNRQ